MVGSLIRNGVSRTFAAVNRTGCIALLTNLNMLGVALNAVNANRNSCYIWRRRPNDPDVVALRGHVRRQGTNYPVLRGQGLLPSDDLWNTPTAVWS